jgi:hypothetical protein
MGLRDCDLDVAHVCRPNGAINVDEDGDAAGAFCGGFLGAGMMGGRQPRKADKHAADQPNGADHTLAQTLKSSQERRAALSLIVDHDPA